MTEQILIRPAREEDADEILKTYAPYIRDTTVTFEYEVPSADEFRSRIRSISAVYPYLVCLIGAETAGYAYAGRQRDRAAYAWNAELSVYIAPSFRRRGIARALYSSLFGILGLQHVVNVYAGVTSPNEASEKLHESLGFYRLGTYRNTGFKSGAWHDVTWYEKCIGSRGQKPEPFVPFRETDKAQIAGITDRCARMIKY